MASLQAAESIAPTRNHKTLIPRPSKIVSIANRIRLLALISNVTLRTLSHLKYSTKDENPPPGTYSSGSPSEHEKILTEQQEKLENLNKKLKEQTQHGGEKFPKYTPK